MASDPRIRAATEADAEGINRCHVGGWKVHYRGLLPDAFLDAIDPQERLAARREALARPRHDSVRNWVLVQEGEIAGWAATGEARDADLGPETHELMAIYLDPGRVGEGFGRALMEHCVADGVARGYGEMTMWVLSDNARARRFYAAAGFVPDERALAVPFRDTGATQPRMVGPLHARGATR